MKTTLSRRLVLASPLAAMLAVPKRARAGQLPFDVRRQVPGSEDDAECIQCVYDSINRTVILLGDVPFGELFSTPLAELAEQLSPRLETLLEVGLLDDPQRVRDITAELVKAKPGVTIGNCFTSTHESFGFNNVATVVALRREGINIPIPAVMKKVAKQRAAVLRAMVQVAPKMTYRGIVEMAHEDHSGRYLKLLGSAKALAMCPDQGPNDRCCMRLRNGTDGCVSNQGTFCAVAVDINGNPRPGLCSGMSDRCPKK
jgi:hypothetical protein